jgi:hypothetical protein
LLFTAITSLNFMGIAFSKPLYRYSKKFEIMPYLFGNCSKLRNPPSFFNKSLIKNTSAFAQC